MAANKKFTPRASANLIDGEVTDSKDVANTEETPVTAPEDVATASAVEETTPEVAPEVAPVVEETKEESKETEGAEETLKAESEITFKAETDKKPIERKVKIRLAKKYDGCIGGVWYHFDKDQVVSVPENVKRILNRSEGMLKPL